MNGGTTVLSPNAADETNFINQALFYLNATVGESEPVVFLTADGTIFSGGSQGMLATNRYDFLNAKQPGIDIEKTTNGPTNSNPTAPDYDNEDAENGPGVPILTPGSTVTWTYKVTNTGNVTFTRSQVVVTDDNGTPGNSADDMSTTNGQITFQSVSRATRQHPRAGRNLDVHGERHRAELSAPAGPRSRSTSRAAVASDGTDGNIRTFTAGGVSVKTSAFSRDTSGVWSTACLGSYGGGLGVTDGSEGDGSNNSHTVDNIGRDNYVLFEFSETVVVDSAFLGYVVDDSDLRIWIGTKTDPFNNHQTLSDAVLDQPRLHRSERDRR